MRTVWAAVLSLVVVACIHNAPPNVEVATLDSFPRLDSIRLIGRMRAASAAISGTIVQTERQEAYEDMCAILCHLRGGSEPNRFYYAKVEIDSMVAKRDATEVKRGGNRWIGWGIPPKDWMPGKGLKAVFLIRKHCWEDFDKERVTRTQANSYKPCDTMWSLAAIEDVADTAAFDFIWRNRYVLGTRSEEEQ